MTIFKCLDCGRLFDENADGLSDIGQTRPACPNCGEEIDIDAIGDYGEDSALADGTGAPY